MSICRRPSSSPRPVNVSHLRHSDVAFLRRGSMLLSPGRFFIYLRRIHTAPFKGSRVFPSKQRNFHSEVVSHISGLRHSSYSIHREVNQKLTGRLISSPCPTCCWLQSLKSDPFGVSSDFKKNPVGAPPHV